MNATDFTISRRSFVMGVSVTAGVVLTGTDVALLAQTPEAPSAGPEVTAWVVIDPDDTVTIRVARSEMGQGTMTALPQLVAEELECDWSRVRSEYASPSENIRRNKVWGPMVTSACLGVRTSQQNMRKAGAQARTMLIAEAASRWNVPPEECRARDSVIRHEKSKHSLRFGEVAAAASRRPIPAEVALKSPDEWRLIGKSLRRLDTPDKVYGKPIFATDVEVPGMLYAAVKACPAAGGKLRSFDAAAVRKMPGVRHIVRVRDDTVAVVADSWWQAKQAIDRLPISWDESAAADLNTSEIKARFRAALDRTDVAVGRRDGDVDQAFGAATKTISAEYDVPYQAHITMEPMTCTAYVTKDKAEIWAGTQNGEGTLLGIAKILEMDPSKVIVNKCHLGGGFGRRGGTQDWAAQAALISQQIGKPVKVIWTRQEDIRRDFYRPLVVARQSAAFDAQGNLTGWKARVAGSSIFHALMPERLTKGEGHDLDMMIGLSDDNFYDVPNLDVTFAMENTAINVGFWRAVNHTQNGFFREVFVDEMAHAVGKDPYQFRRTLLAKYPRSLELIDAVAKHAKWGRTADGVYQGIALVESYDSVCAQVVDLSVSKDNEVTLHRVVVGIDPGYAANPASIIAQMEGSVVWAIPSVMDAQITHTRGRVDQSNYHDFPPLRMYQMPQVDTLVLPTGDRFLKRWGGVGEPGVPPLAPAVVNAIFAATGKRIRSLPLTNHGFRWA